MVRVPPFDPIEFLVRRKFPRYTEPRPRTPSMHPGSPDIPKYPALVDRADAYRQQLLKMSEADRDVLVAQEMQALNKERAEAEEREEQQRFFNLPSAAADFDYWSRMAYWAIDEGVALSLGKDPREVHWNRLKPLLDRSKFAREFRNRRELALRAEIAGQITKLSAPGFFLAWAARTGFDFPNKLIETVVTRGVPIADWKSLYDEAKAKIEALEREHDALRNQAGPGSVEPPEEAAQKPLRTRERETVLKLVLGVALEKYGYEPNAKKSPTAREIASDLALHGLSLDEDTVRKWLKEARDILPRDTETDDIA